MLTIIEIDVVDAHTLEDGDIVQHDTLGPLTIKSLDDQGDTIILTVTDEKEDEYDVPANPFDKFVLMTEVDDAADEDI